MAQAGTHIPGIFELHKSGARPSKTLVVIFSSPANTSFTFKKTTDGFEEDRLFIRDPFGRSWYQQGLADGETLDALEARIAGVAAGYGEVWMLGSSMGGYAALYFGARLRADRVLAISPQIIVDERFERGPLRTPTIHTPCIADLIRRATATHFTIVFGGVDLIDAYNIAQLYLPGDSPMHIRSIHYVGVDHMLPKHLDKDCSLRAYFRSVLSDHSVPCSSIPFLEGNPLSPERYQCVDGLVRLLLDGELASIYPYVQEQLQRFQGWDALEYYGLVHGLRTGTPARVIAPRASAIADATPRAADFAYIAAEAHLKAGDLDMARQYLNRVFKVRSAHGAGRKLLKQIDAAQQNT